MPVLVDLIFSLTNFNARLVCIFLICIVTGNYEPSRNQSEEALTLQNSMLVQCYDYHDNIGNVTIYHAILQEPILSQGKIVLFSYLRYYSDKLKISQYFRNIS
jgi:hypothetical protein